MQISNVLAGWADPATVAKRNDPLEAAGSRAAKAADAGAASTPGNRAALGQILGKYDVKRITPNEFAEMIQKLNKAGAISEGEFQELAAVRLDLESANLKPDEPLNLMEFYAQKIKDAQRQSENADTPAGRTQLKPLLRRLEWIEKFSTIQSNPGAAGVDAIA
jgi:hypothetical protein